MYRPRLTLRQLSYLVATAELGNFTRAAERIGISQPALSQQIRGLEDVLGGPLFERGGETILTPLGRDAVERAQKVLLAARELEELRATDADWLAGTIRLGVSPTLGPYVLPALAARLHREHPGLRMHVREAPPSALSSGLATGEYDVILAQLPVTGRTFHIERLFREQLHIAMAADHPLRDRAEIMLADLHDQNLLTLTRGYRLTEQLAAISAETGATLLRDYEGTSLDAVRQMAGLGMGLTLLPELYVRQEVRDGADVVVRPFSGGRYYREIGLIWRLGTGRTKAFDLIATYLRAMGP